MPYYIDETGVEYLEEGAGTLLKWTTEKPTKEGWYWVHIPNSYDNNNIECLRILFDYKNEPFDADSISYGVGVNLSCVTHWLGPLPIPELPTK